MYFIKTTSRNIDRTKWKAYIIINDTCIRRCEEMYVYDQRRWMLREREKYGNGFDVTKYIMHKCGEMSVWKLQKRCYYSQACHLAWTGNPIFEEDFKAWANGPVCPELFHMHQGKFFVCMDDFAGGYPDALTEDEKDSVNIVIHDYGDMEPYDLRELSHSEAPWKDVRGDLPAWTKNRTVITKNKMGEYYGSL